MKGDLSSEILSVMVREKKDPELGERIRYLREDVLGISSQAEFAVEIGGDKLSRGAVGNWERGLGIKTDNLRKIATRFEVSFDWLATGTGPRPEPATHWFGEEDRKAWVSRYGDGLGERSKMQSLWCRLSEEQRRQVIAYVDGMLADKPPPAPLLPQAPLDTVRSRLKPEPEVPTIGGGRAPHIYLDEWMDRRGLTAEMLAGRLYTDASVILKLADGTLPYNEDWLWEIAKALNTSVESLYGPPPPRSKAPASKSGRRQSSRRPSE